MSTIKNYLSGYIGATDVKFELNCSLHSLATKPNNRADRFRFVGPAGAGKTHAMDAFISSATEILSDKGFTYAIYDVPTGMTKRQFIDGWNGQKLTDYDYVFFRVDEAHAHNMTASPLWQSAKCMMDAQSIRDVPFSDTEFLPANPFRHFWCLASNEDIKDAAIRSRCKAINVSMPTKAECVALFDYFLTVFAPDAKLTEEAKNHFLTHTLANPRELRDFVKSLAKFPADEFTLDTAHEVTRRFNYSPLGLRLQHRKMLVAMNNNSKGLQVGELAIIAGEARDSASSMIQDMQALELVVTTSQGRKALAPGGVRYLAMLADLKKAAKAAHDAEKQAANAQVPRLENAPAVEETDAKPATTRKRATASK